MAAISLPTLSKPYVATHTLAAIDAAMQKDGGALYRQHLRTTILWVEDAYREESDEFRTHLGASLIGSDCLRELWYVFRWAVKSKPSSRFIRLFNRGHLEEARFMALLLTIGCEIWSRDSNGKQFKVSFHNGHFGGSTDCLVKGVPDWPSATLLVECKTHKDDSFTKMVNDGLRISKFKHYSQTQVYTVGLDLPGALYMAVNKDTDDLYAELVQPNPEHFKQQLDRAGWVIKATLPPKKINESPGWWMCKMCRQKHVCHKIPDESGTVPLPERNCRTCLYSKPLESSLVEAGWECQYHSILLSKEAQLAGCDKYTLREM